MGGFDIAQADFNREFATILAAAGKVETDTHRSGAGLFEEMRHMPFMDFTEAFGDEKGMGFADQLIFCITKNGLSLVVGEQNRTGVVHDDDPLGERFQKPAYCDVFLE